MNYDPASALTVKQARELFPGRPSLQTVWRYINPGSPLPDGTRVRLASYKRGGRRFVDRQAIADFIAATSAEPPAPPPPPPAGSQSQQRRAKQARGRLDRMLAST